MDGSWMDEEIDRWMMGIGKNLDPSLHNGMKWVKMQMNMMITYKGDNA